MLYFDNKQREILTKVSKDLNLPEEVVTAAYFSMWQCIREKCKELDLNDATKEEFEATRHSFVVPKIGRLYADWWIIYAMQMKRKNKIIRDGE